MLKRRYRFQNAIPSPDASWLVGGDGDGDGDDTDKDALGGRVRLAYFSAARSGIF